MCQYVHATLFIMCGTQNFLDKRVTHKRAKLSKRILMKVTNSGATTKRCFNVITFLIQWIVG